MGFIIVGTCWTIKASAATVDLIPVADATVSAANSTNNYGGGGALSLAGNGAPSSKGEFQSVLRFDASSAKSSFDLLFGIGQWTVQSIELRLYADIASGAIFNAPNAGQFSTSWMANDSWVEGTGTVTAPKTDGITFASLPSYLSGSDEALGTFSYDGTTDVTKPNTYSLTLAPDFLSDVSAGNLVSLQLSPADTSVSYFFHSRSYSQSAARAALTITAVPEPASGCLLTMGAVLVTLWMIVRRR